MFEIPIMKRSVWHRYYSPSS